jgi:NAD(P)-dependent dehydrogenase (short-subunit alcohol dehydrogenase family)
MKRFVLVTGASTGIGKSACLALAKQGYDVLAGVRTTQDAELLKSSVTKGIHPLLMDLTDEESLLSARTKAEEIIGQNPFVAIFNNAGMVINGTVLHVPIAQWNHQFQVNVFGAVRILQLFFPLLIKEKLQGDNHPRRIINMSSVSGHFASPFIGPYAASKYALEALSDSLRRELYMYDVQVVLIVAGKIATPIWEKAKRDPAYFGSEYDGILQFKDQMIDNMITQGLPVERVDKLILKAVSAKRAKLRYYIVPNKWNFFLMRYMPARLIDKLIQGKLKTKSGIRPF